MNGDLVHLLSTGLLETIYMLVLSTVIALLIGFPFGVILVVTGRNHLLDSPKVNSALGSVINVIRSFPGLILIVVLLPLSRLIVGTTLGATASLVPLSISAAPFIARIIESSLKEVDHGKIEASLAMGATPAATILKVLVPEALPSLARGVTIAVIAILGLTAIAGATGAGGLGSLAIRFGYQRFRDDVMIGTVAILVILVETIQLGGDRIARHINRRRHVS